MWKIGERLRNRWEIFDIKHGGMGDVYIVFDHETQRRLAAKTYRDELFDREPGIAARFTEEAAAWINLDFHPNVARAFEIWKIRRKPFVFVEYISGGALDRWIGTRTFSPDGHIPLYAAIQICDGMLHAASKDMSVHGDLKPQNCLVQEAPPRAAARPIEIKITDFGLSRHVAEKHHQMLALLNSAGTPAYMAPERFDRRTPPLPASDVYAFGILLFQLLTGSLKREVELLPPRYSELDELLSSCTSNQPDERPSFESIRQVLAAFHERHFASLDFVRLQEISHDRMKPVAGEKDVIRISGPVTPGAKLFANPAWHWANKAVSLRRLDHLDDALAAVDQALRIEPDLVEALVNKSSILMHMDRYEEALQCLEQAVAMKPDFAGAWSNKGTVLRTLGRTAEAREAFEQCLLFNPNEGAAALGLAQLCDREGDEEQALVWYGRAFLWDPELIVALEESAHVLTRLGRHAEALTLLTRAGELRPENTAEMANRAGALSQVGRDEESLQLLDHAVRVDPSNAEIWYNAGYVARKLGRNQVAMQCLDNALKLDQRLRDAWRIKGEILLRQNRLPYALACFERQIEVDPSDLAARCRIGMTLQASERYEEALPVYDEVLREDDTFAEAWMNKGIALAKLGRDAEAIPALERALALGIEDARAEIDESWAHLSQPSRSPAGKDSGSVDGVRKRS